jgi:hypothetical protein
MLTARPVLPAATSRSVCRHRNAGICSTSTASAATSQWPGSCTSVSTGRPVSLASGPESACPPEAGTAKALHAGAVGLVVAGFEDEGNAQVAVMRCRASAMVRTWASLSITHGPAIRKSWPAPTCTGPISNELLTKAILPCASFGPPAHFLLVGPRPLPKRPFQRMERRGRREISLRLHDPALGQVLAARVVFGIERHVVPRVAQRLQGAIIQHRIALRVDRRQDRRSDGNVDAAQPTSAFTASSAEASGDAATASALRCSRCCCRSGNEPSAPTSSERWFQGWAACIRRSNRFSGLEGGCFKLPLSFAGFLPILSASC